MEFDFRCFLTFAFMKKKNISFNLTFSLQDDDILSSSSLSYHKLFGIDVGWEQEIFSSRVCHAPPFQRGAWCEDIQSEIRAFSFSEEALPLVSCSVCLAAVKYRVRSGNIKRAQRRREMLPFIIGTRIINSALRAWFALPLHLPAVTTTLPACEVGRRRRQR